LITDFQGQFVVDGDMNEANSGTILQLSRKPD